MRNAKLNNCGNRIGVRKLIFKKIAIASDHAGYEQKEAIKIWLSQNDYEVTDLGCNSKEHTDYPIYAKACADAVAKSQAEVGILVCGTGIGMQIVANKVKGIRAANVIAPDFARLARRHNDANIITLSGKFVDLESNKEILDVFLNTQASMASHHLCRIEMIKEIER